MVSLKSLTQDSPLQVGRRALPNASGKCKAQTTYRRPLKVETASNSHYIFSYKDLSSEIFIALYLCYVPAKLMMKSCPSFLANLSRYGACTSLARPGIHNVNLRLKYPRRVLHTT